ncbi:N-alpha-acetyltransferase 38, NatC auxiliary subunit [Coccinella septempunctata]|uniref:N-alpha-acetyltransferase 38, NatC auxiliary subunit n=1 Tax=Coccinella septempunctata TaxID=41139 RepID=UPI001D061ADA|nr:N-alpha-acetyltransferase 38, NatC auxiliary subunit [Coccinella septempunctata]
MDLVVPTLKPPENMTGVQKLRQLLNKTLRIEMSDGRVLIGIFLCTDADANVILGSCSEYLPQEFRLNKAKEEPRMLGLVMVPGKHIVTVSKDTNDPAPSYNNGPSVEVQDVI